MYMFVVLLVNRLIKIIIILYVKLSKVNAGQIYHYIVEISNKTIELP